MPDTVRMPGRLSRSAQWLVDAVKRAAVDYAKAHAERDRLISEALAVPEIPVSEVARAAGLSRRRVIQIEEERKGRAS